jgi:agmatine deiminase
MLILSAGGEFVAADEPARGAEVSFPRLPADFETQKVLVLGWDKVDPPVQQVVIAVAREVAGKLPAVILVPSETERQTAITKALAAGVPADALRVVTVPINTCWVRDFAPLCVEKERAAFHLLDADYIADKRSDDDAIASSIGPLLGLPVGHLPLILEGGNLLSNGRGLVVTTTKLADENTARDLDRSQVEKLLHKSIGARQVVHLEPLLAEMTGHVDLFAAFTAPDTIVVASSNRKSDRINTEILERNATQLAAINFDGKPLRVVRLPLPPRVFEVWRSYTNVVFANGKLLVPKYAGVDDKGHAEAIATYRKLLPGWSIASIDCEPLARMGGALRCATACYAGVKSLPPVTSASAPAPRSP